ncbi:YeiH family protein [Raineyella sp. LH-20]|uniref:YeiH family protein n=1 Tax=Raineyella sp. LH-20 TaxID=3081204 RepID=UPI002954E272|nr:putative sulfate exporter family transporter [Raineyella sp. LH-20]WOP18155.1 putative sulfate exporter family transporter [Raineyella sp. LH-20]
MPHPSDLPTAAATDDRPVGSDSRSPLLRSEDWWSVWVGLFLVVLSVLLWALGGSIAAIAPQIAKWSSFPALGAQLGGHAVTIVALYVVLGALFTLVAQFLRIRTAHFVAGFTALFLGAVVITIVATWSWASAYNLEAPLVALVVGLLVGNLAPAPAWLDSALRTELYVKVGIVLLGATLPFTLIVKAGPVAFVQATVIALATFLVIYVVGTRLLGLDQRFAATLGAGGSICGVSASIAVGSSVKAKKEQVSVTISLVVVWAVAAIFLLTAIAKALGLHPGVAGAWIGSSEFADAAGITAASAFGEQGLAAFTLVKVVGRDIFIGIWSLILAVIAITYWDRRDAAAAGAPRPRVDVAQIWHRFPKFVLGFFVGSIVLTVLILAVGTAGSAAVTTDVINPIKDIRTWVFTLTFLSIGLTTRFRDLTSVGWRPLAAFSAGAVVNILLGFGLSAGVLAGFWSSL